MSFEKTRYYLIPLIISIGMFIETLDTTILNTAIPVMAKSLTTNPIDLKVALISYLLSLAVFIPISGWLADKFGQRSCFVLATVIFTLGSLSCGFSTSLQGLMIARFFQGIGGALMVPVGRLILVSNFNKSEYIEVINRVIVVGLIGTAVGPFLGGVITEYFSWRWIFFINIPFGVINVILAYQLITNIKNHEIPPLDFFGFILFGLSLAVFVFTLAAASENVYKLSHIFYLLVSSVIGFILYFFYSRKSPNPILKLKLFSIRTFRVSMIASLLTRTTTSGLGFLLPILFQVSFGYSPLKSGLLTLPTALGAMSAKSFTSKLLRKLGPKKYLLINTCMFGLVICSAALIEFSTPLWLTILIVFLIGMLMSMQYSGMNPLSISDVSKEDYSSSTSLFSTNQQIAMSVGVAFSALLLALLGNNISTYHGLPTSVLHQTFLVQGILTIMLASVFLLLHKNDGLTLYTTPEPAK